MNELPIPVAVLTGFLGAGKTSLLNSLLKEIWPFLIGLLVALGVITYVPGLSLWLPKLLGP